MTGLDKIIITEIRGYEGEYDFDPSYFTNKELHTIKRLAGVRAGEIHSAFAAGDNDLMVAFALIALERSGKAVYEDVLWNAKVGCIEFRPETVEGAADPPTIASDDDKSEKIASSGASSSSDSENQENGQSRTGILPSELSAA